MPPAKLLLLYFCALQKNADDVTLSNLSPTCSPLSPPSHTHYFIPGSKLAFSTNIFHHRLRAPTWTAFSDYNLTGFTLLNDF